MLLIEILPNLNCDSVDLRVFHELGPPCQVTHARLDPSADPHGAGWFALTGWTLAGQACPALAHKVDDSGEGVALLVSGGDAGLRLQPEGREAPWRLDDSAQQGVPFLLVADATNLRFA